MGWNPKIRFNVNSWNAQENKKGETNGVKLEQVGVKGVLELFSTQFRNVSLNG